jgi:hypothetical protein
VRINKLNLNITRIQDSSFIVSHHTAALSSRKSASALIYSNSGGIGKTIKETLCTTFSHEIIDGFLTEPCGGSNELPNSCKRWESFN